MLYFLIPIGLGLIAAALIVADVRRAAKSESRLVNAHWLDDRRKFHMMARWGAQY